MLSLQDGISAIACGKLPRDAEFTGITRTGLPLKMCVLIAFSTPGDEVVGQRPCHVLTGWNLLSVIIFTLW